MPHKDREPVKVALFATVAGSKVEKATAVVFQSAAVCREYILKTRKPGLHFLVCVACFTVLCLSTYSAGDKSATLLNPIKSANWSVEELNLRIPNCKPAVLVIATDRAIRMRVSIVGPDGRCARTLLKDAKWSKGEHTLQWDGRDDLGRQVPSEAYTPFLQEYVAGSWVAVLNPNADNHGIKAEIKAVEWDQLAGRLILYTPVPARLRVWVIHGDDGQIVASLKDMEPAGKGMLSLTWRARDTTSNFDLNKLGTLTYHIKGYALADCSIIVESNLESSYLEWRQRYQVLPEAAPNAYPDSFSLYRYPYEEQKEIRFRTLFSGDTIRITPESAFLGILSQCAPEVKIFWGKKFVTLPLTRDPGQSSTWTARIEHPEPRGDQSYSVLLGTERDQFGFSTHFTEEPEKLPMVQRP